MHPSTTLRAAALAAAALLPTGLPAAAQFYGYGYGYPAPYGGYGPYGYNAPPPPPGPYYGGRPYDGSYGEARPLTPRQIVRRLEELGYDDVERPRFTGTLYLVEATGPGDVRMRLAVDAIRGVVLNRTAIGEPRRFRDDDDDDDDAGPRRFGARPLDPGPDLRPTLPGGGRPDQPGSRDSTRGLGAPADPRLAPSGEMQSRPFEGRTGNRQASRTDTKLPPRTTPPATGPGAVSGTNPDAAGVRPPVDARRPTNGTRDATRPGTTGPAGASSTARPGQPPQATAEARPGRPVRVIEGVTPMSGPSAPPVAAPNQLDTLPAPPPVPPVTSVD